MKSQITLMRLSALILLLFTGQVAKSEVPFALSYFDSTWHSVNPTSSEYNRMAAMGINIANDSYTGINLDLVQASGMQGMVDFNGPDYLAVGKEKVGVRFEVDPTPDTSLTNDDKLAIAAQAQNLASQHGSHPALLGYYVRDEPHASEFPALAYAQQQLLANDPDCLPIINLFPNYASSSQLGTSSYDQYVSQFISTVQPKVLSYDHYTYNSSHYSNLATIRQHAMNANIPYWYIYSACPVGNHIPDPTEGQLRWQMYTALAYGFKGLSAFTYTTVAHPDYSDVGDALIYKDSHTPTPKYYIVQEIYGEIEKLAPTLKDLSSWGVYGNGVDNFYVTNVSGGDLLYGNFTDPSGKTYMMFTNKDYNSGDTFSISLGYHNSSLYNGIARVDKETGELVLVDTPGNVLTLSLSAGDGELFKVLADNTLASTPTNLTAERALTTISLDWDSSIDPQSGIDFYYIYRDGERLATSNGSYFTDTGLDPFSAFIYEVSAVNGEGLESDLSTFLLTGTLPLYGDANTDGVVDEQDASILASNWMATSDVNWYDGDFNGDGKVNEEDASILAANWQVGAASSASVPEPGMMVLLAGLLLIFGLSRRK